MYDILAFGIPSMFQIIQWIVITVGKVLYTIFVDIAPFLVIYVGIPLFIMGILLGLLFFGGHLLFLVVFFVGIYFYIRGAFDLKIKPGAKPSTSNNANNKL
jgi:hypothetical protein